MGVPAPLSILAGVNIFQWALSVFLVSHVVVAVPAMRRHLTTRWSERGFLLGYSVMSTGLFTWLIISAMQAPTTALWPAALWAYWVPVILMPVALTLLGASVLTPNPLSIALVPGGLDPKRPGAVAVTRHPILWGLGLWGATHVPPNGDTVMLTLFGGLAFFAFTGMLIVERKKRRVLGEEGWRALAAGTSIIPFLAILSGRARFPTDLRTLAGGLLGAAAAVYLLAGGHLTLFHRDPLSLF
ncbi:MAG: hypothetical protein AMXMBFR8_20580 [Nevskiales bacterium]